MSGEGGPGGWLDALASDAPTPGGGAAAAMAVAMGAALAAMVTRRSTRHLPHTATLVDRAEHLRAVAIDLADADAIAYQRLMAVRREAGGPEAVREAFQSATEVPLRVAETGVDVTDICGRLAEGGNPNLRGDAVTGAFVARAGTDAAATLVEINVAEGGLAVDLAGRARAAAARATSISAALRADMASS